MWEQVKRAMVESSLSESGGKEPKEWWNNKVKAAWKEVLLAMKRQRKDL